MQKVLALCFFPAFVPSSNGGQTRLFNFYRSLSKWYEVTLITSTHFGVEEECVLHGSGFIERRIPKDDYFLQQYAKLDKYGSGGDLSGPAIAACAEFPTRLHKVYLEEYDGADLIIYDDPFTGAYDLFAGLDQKLRIYNSYNCETQLYSQLHPDKNSKVIRDIVEQAEKKILKASDLVLYCNEGDLTAFHEMVLDYNFAALYAPNGMQPLPPIKSSQGLSKKRFRAVFMGSGHPPNVHAVQFIVKKIAPELPEIDFDIIGGCLSEGSYPPNVYRHGVVSDIDKQQILALSNIALNPMMDGSGSNVKVLDFFSRGIPVMSTSFGMRGIEAQPGKDYLDVELNQFADKLRSYASESKLLAEIAESGKTLALKNYTWDTILKKISSAIKDLAADKAAKKKQYVLALNDYDSFAGIGGGATRTKELYASVSKWCPVVFIAFSDNGRLQTRQHDSGITIINVPKTQEHLAELIEKNNQYHVTVDDIIAGRHCTINPYLSEIYRILRKNARCIVIEHCYLVDLPRYWRDRFVYSSQNHELVLKKNLLEHHPLKQSLLVDVERFERLAVGGAAVTIAVSKEDADSLVRGRREAGPILIVPNGASVPTQGAVVEQLKIELRSQVGKRAVVFLGSAHMPNVEACRFIVENLAPKLTNLKFHILGSVCSSIGSTPHNVKLWGVVDDDTKSAVMQSCALAINPMLSGGGSNVKLADYIGNGLFVVTTDFGQRGYPVSVQQHLNVVTIDNFALGLAQSLEQKELQSKMAREARKLLFQRELSMQGLAARFVKVLQELETKRRRVLYVTYRYASPALGGAEVNLEKFVAALGQSGKFDVDVVAPEISAINSFWRFSERYTFDDTCSALVDIPNVRYARFPIEVPSEAEALNHLRRIWHVQPCFERAVSEQLASRYTESGLAWGWSYPEGESQKKSRWAFIECGIHLHSSAQVVIDGYTPNEIMISALADGVIVGGPWQLNGNIRLEFNAPAGQVTLVTSAKIMASDPRPLGFHVSRLFFDGKTIDLAAPMLSQVYLSAEPAQSAFHILDCAAHKARDTKSTSLTNSRGPWSPRLEQFITKHVSQYDLVIANNNVFRPAVIAMAEAKRQGVPSILIPHAHLDDDFYHFPDVLQSARDATLVLAVPKAACDFFREKGCNAEYLPAGCDINETFKVEDKVAFENIYNSKKPFVLVLGRKAGAKGYQHVVDAIEELNKENIGLNAVLIGPDDDGVEINSKFSIYLGRQPRNVVRGALMSCMALCNMSSSESFGIVLLEAWLAGKPVIVNKNCAAFHDFAVDGENARLVDIHELHSALKHLMLNYESSKQLAINGRYIPRSYSWDVVSNSFLDLCLANATSH